MPSTQQDPLDTVKLLFITGSVPRTNRSPAARRASPDATKQFEADVINLASQDVAGQSPRNDVLIQVEHIVGVVGRLEIDQPVVCL